MVVVSHTRSGLMDFIAKSSPRLTFIMFPVIWRIVTAVLTRPATASTREASCRRLSFSFCLRMAFPAYIRAMSLWPCFIAYVGFVSSARPRWKGRLCAFSSFVFSACSSFPALMACRFSDLAVNCYESALIQVVEDMWGTPLG